MQTTHNMALTLLDQQQQLTSKQDLTRPEQILLADLTLLIDNLSEWTEVPSDKLGDVLRQHPVLFTEAIGNWYEEHPTAILKLINLLDLPDKEQERQKQFMHLNAPFVLNLPKKVAQEKATILHALSHPTRLQILHVLKQYQGKICVDEIATCLVK